MATKKVAKGQSKENPDIQIPVEELPDTTEVVSNEVVSNEVVGNEFQDALIKNKKRKRHPGNWKPMTEEDLAKYQAAGDLIGWDADRKEGLLRE